MLTAIAIGYILFLLYETSLVVSYGRAFGWGIVKAFDQAKGDDFFLFLKSLYPRRFFVSLVCCPYCLGFWICMASFAICEYELKIFLPLCALSMLTYMLLKKFK